MTWELLPADRFAVAMRKLAKLDPQTARRVAKALQNLRDLDDPTTRCKALTGPLRGLWRLRVGDFRVIVDIQRGQLTIIAMDVGHRSMTYD